jgi:hypothetical protein
MHRIEDLLRMAIAPRVLGHDPAAGHHHDPIDVALDGHGPERPGPRHAVPVGVEHHRLVLVGDGRARDAGVERALGQRRRGGELLGEAVADDERAGGRADGPAPLVEASSPQMFVRLM